MRGGRFEGEGAYACTFTPSPKCSSDRVHKVTNELAKVFNSANAIDEEWKYAQRMREVDPSQKFLIYPTTRCDVVKSEILKDPTAFQCSFLSHRNRRDRHKQYGMLKMPYGGVALDEQFEHSLKGVSANTFINCIQQILRAVKLLARHKLVHNDLKFNNVVVNPNTWIVKVIDFGLVIPFEHAFSLSQNRFLRKRYWLHPPEYRIVPMLNGSHNAQTLFEAELDLLDIFFSELKPTTLKEFILEHLFSYDELQRVYTRYITRVSKKENPLQYLSKYAHKIDIYSLGISCVHLSLFVTYASNAQKQQCMQILRSMIHPDPTKRSSIPQLLSMLENAKV